MGAKSIDLFGQNHNTFYDTRVMIGETHDKDLRESNMFVLQKQNYNYMYRSLNCFLFAIYINLNLYGLKCIFVFITLV